MSVSDDTENSTADRISSRAARVGARGKGFDRSDARQVLAVLEADQLFAAKQRTRFGRRPLARRDRAVLWTLRIYVLVMLVIVLVSVFRALH